MSVIFISHSSLDNARAIWMRDWLKANGWDQVFIDIDAEQGLAPGQRWSEELRRAGEACTAVILLISPNWVTSPYCKTEYLFADTLGKKIIPVLIAPMAPGEITAEVAMKYQSVDVSTPEIEADGLERLRVGMRRAGLHPQSFDWPPPNEPNRPVYHGLRALDVQDAAMFFGREAAITRALDELRQMRDNAPKRMLSVLGASGAGKSSFLRAGLIARLARDELNFLVAPIVRPERAALSGVYGLAASLSRLSGQTLNLNSGEQALADAFAAARAPVLERFRANAQAAGEIYALKPPTIVIPIDQAEELFTGDNTEQSAFCTLLERAVERDGNVLVIATVRTDSYEAVQNGLMREQQNVFTLPRVAPGAFHAIVEGPARLAKPPLRIEPALTQRLLEELDSSDALPLVAFTLERLYRLHATTGSLTLAHYERLGGLQGSIEAAIEETLAAALAHADLPNTRGELETLLRRAFIPWLASINPDTHAPRRRVAAIRELPREAQPLIRLLIDQRLLSSDARDGDATVEPAHEALLRQWQLLNRWLEEEQAALSTLESVKRATTEWIGNGADTAAPEWLEHRGLRLLAAEEVMAREDFSIVAGAQATRYIAACRQAENAEAAREATRLEQLREHVDRNRRLQRRGFVLLVAAFATLIAGVAGVLSVVQGLNQRRSETLAALARQALNEGRADRAARYALAGVRGRNAWLVGFDASAAESMLRIQQQSSGALGALHNDGQTRTAFFSPDSSRVLTASFDRTAALWDASTGALLRRFRGHEHKVEHATFSPDGALIATVSFDGTARIWRADSDGAALHVLDHNEGRRRAVQIWESVFSPDGALLATAGGDGRVRVWDASTGALVHRFEGHRRRITDLAFSADGSQLISASDEGDVKIWTPRTGVVTQIFERPAANSAGSTLFALNEAQGLLAIAYQNGVLSLWNLRTGAPIATQQAHTNFIRQISFNAEMGWFLLASSDGAFSLWDADTLEPVRRFTHGAAARGAVFSNTGRRIVSVGDDRAARIWDAFSGELLFTYAGHEGSIWMASFAPDGSAFVTAAADGQARLWRPDVRQDQLAVTLKGHTGTVRSVAFSPNGRYVATASYTAQDPTARIWDARSGRLLRVINAGVTQSVAFSPDGRLLATAQVDTAQARIWDWENCSLEPGDACEEGAPMQHGARVMDVMFSADGRDIITASRDNLSQIWRLDNRATPRATFPHMAGPFAAALSPDGAFAASVSYEDGYIWSTENGIEVCRLDGHTEAMRDVNFSHDGAFVVTAAEDRTVRIWDARSCAQIGEAIELPGDSIWSAEFSPDDSMIAIASQAHNDARLYDVRTRALVHVLIGHTNAVYDAAFSPDGQYVITGSDDLSARIWTLPPRHSLEASTLADTLCEQSLSAGLSVFSDDEIRNAPVLSEIDRDPCNPPSLWERVSYMAANAWSRFRAHLDVAFAPRPETTS